MKKLITLFAATLLCISATNAQHYRGFFDINLSMPTVKLNGGEFTYSTSEGKEGLGLGVTTSHGVQLKNYFIGAGLGCFYVFGAWESFPIPLFVDGRYDFFSAHKANFFIDCKLGYILNTTSEFDFDGPHESYVEFDGKWGNLFFNPSVGVRFRCSKVCGFNIALGYMPLLIKLSSVHYCWREELELFEKYLGKKFTDHRLTLTLGVDF